MTTICQKYTIKYKKQIFAIVAILLLCTTLLTTFPQAHAVGIGTGKTFQEYKDSLISAGGGAGSTYGFIYDILCVISGCHPDFSFSAMAGSLYKFASFQGDLGEFVENITGKRETFTLLSAAQAMYRAFKVAGIALILLYFLIEIMDEVQADNFNVEHLVKKLISLAIAILVMQQGDKILGLIVELGDALIDDANQVAQAGKEELYTHYEMLYEGLTSDDGLFSIIKAFLFAIGVLLENLVAYLLMLVAWIIAYLTAYSRFIEILVRFAFAPLGIAQLVSGGSKGPGMRYIKKFAACCLQGAICVLAFGVVDIIQDHSNDIAGMLGQFILPITLIGFLFRTKQIAEDVVGV